MDGSLSAVATAYRPGSAEAFDSAARQRFKQLLPHLQRAMQLRARLAQADVARDGLRRALAALGKPALLIDPYCRILFANPPAEKLIAREAAGWIDRTRMSAWLRPEASALGRLVFDMLQRGGAGGRMVLHRPSGRPLVLLASPLHRSQSIHASPTGLILIDGAGRHSASPDDQLLLKEAFGLTTTESKIAIGLIEGLKVRDLPPLHDVALTTVRTHVAHLLQKTNVRSQSELLALLLRMGL